MVHIASVSWNRGNGRYNPPTIRSWVDHTPTIPCSRRTMDFALSLDALLGKTYCTPTMVVSVWDPKLQSRPEFGVSSSCLVVASPKFRKRKEDHVEVAFSVSFALESDRWWYIV